MGWVIMGFFCKINVTVLLNPTPPPLHLLPSFLLHKHLFLFFISPFKPFLSFYLFVSSFLFLIPFSLLSILELVEGTLNKEDEKSGGGFGFSIVSSKAFLRLISIFRLQTRRSVAPICSFLNLQKHSSLKL